MRYRVEFQPGHYGWRVLNAVAPTSREAALRVIEDNRKEDAQNRDRSWFTYRITPVE